jgi:hypothetical protein
LGRLRLERRLWLWLEPLGRRLWRLWLGRRLALVKT